MKIMRRRSAMKSAKHAATGSERSTNNCHREKFALVNLMTASPNDNASTASRMQAMAGRMLSRMPARVAAVRVRAAVNGSPGRARTADPVVNSHLLYQLSYRGTTPQS